MDDAIWSLPPVREEARTIAADLGIPLPIAQVLVNRRILDSPSARRFLHGTMDDTHDPFLFTAMRAAVERIEAAIVRREKILIFGDYDADGVLSTVMLHKALTTLGGDVDYFIPERLTEGYGIKDEHLAVVLARGAKLVVSVDCGVRAVDFVEAARAAGVDVVVTDHHLPGDVIPAAAAVLDPVLDGAGYPERTLAGVGVVFKLIQALYEKQGRKSALRHFLKLVAIGTISDIADLRGENRIFVKQGLLELENVSNIGLRHLLDVCGRAGKKVSEGDVGFRIGPRLNAAGRMGRTDLAVRLFFSDSDAETREIARRLDELNSERQRIEERIFKQACEKIRAKGLDSRYRILILGSEDWHRGVVGIVASKIKDAFNRPAILFAYEDGNAFGSGRSIGEFSLIACLDECRDHLLAYGGHTYAVGCTLARESLSAFKQAANAAANVRLTDDHLRRKLRLDAVLGFEEIDRDFLGVLGNLGPFGVGNPKPVFMTEKVEVAAGPQILKRKHLKLWLRRDGRTFEAVAWDRADWAERISKSGLIDVAYSFLFSNYQGEDRLQLSLEGVRP